MGCALGADGHLREAQGRERTPFTKLNGYDICAKRNGRRAPCLPKCAGGHMREAQGRERTLLTKLNGYDICAKRKGGVAASRRSLLFPSSSLSQGKHHFALF